MALSITTAANTGINNSNNATSYATGSFTPAANDWLVIMACITDTAVLGAITDTQAIVYDRLISTSYNSGVDRMFLFVGQTLHAASANTVTISVGGDAGTGCNLATERVAGGRSAVDRYRQFAFATGAGGTTPAVVMDMPFNTNNGGLCAVFNGTNTPTLTPPTGWTEVYDQGHLTPASGIEMATRLTGETGSTITWGTSSATAWGAMVIEIYEAAQPPLTGFFNREFVQNCERVGDLFLPKRKISAPSRKIIRQGFPEPCLI